MVDRSQTLKIQKSSTCTDLSFSFKKSNRFNSKDEKPIDFYNIPTAFSKRSTSFGFGKRSTLIGLTTTPSPDKYNPITRKPTGLAISRSGIGERQKLFSTISPGPGAYSVSPIDNTPKFIFNSRHPPKKVEDSPCAANYNPNFSYVLKSKYKGIGFGFGKKVDPSRNPEIPGPGAYSIPHLFPKIKLRPAHSFTKPRLKTIVKG